MICSGKLGPEEQLHSSSEGSVNTMCARPWTGDCRARGWLDRAQETGRTNSVTEPWTKSWEGQKVKGLFLHWETTSRKVLLCRWHFLKNPLLTYRLFCSNCLLLSPFLTFLILTDSIIFSGYILMHTQTCFKKYEKIWNMLSFKLSHILALSKDIHCSILCKSRRL